MDVSKLRPDFGLSVSITQCGPQTRLKERNALEFAWTGYRTPICYLTGRFLLKICCQTCKKYQKKVSNIAFKYDILIIKIRPQKSITKQSKKFLLLMREGMGSHKLDAFRNYISDGRPVTRSSWW